VCAKLHNICIDCNVPIVERFHADWMDGDINDVFLSELHGEDDNIPTIAHGLTNGSRRN
jgi:hypothetical protein